jgi:hypothetical protein
MCNQYTRYALAIPTKNQFAKTTAEAFFNHFIVHYDIPKRIHSDQGTNFESKGIKELSIYISSWVVAPQHEVLLSHLLATWGFVRTSIDMVSVLLTWEQDPYIVVSQPNTDILVYNLRKENNEGRARTLHRNLLLPIGYIRDVPTPAPRKLLKRPPIPAKRTTRQKIGFRFSISSVC